MNLSLQCNIIDLNVQEFQPIGVTQPWLLLKADSWRHAKPYSELCSHTFS